MLKFLLFLFFDLKGFSTAYAITGYSYPFSLFFEHEVVRPYFSFNSMQYDKGKFLKDGYYSFSFGYNIDSLTSLRSTISSYYFDAKNEFNDFSLLTGKKFFSLFSGYIGFYGEIEKDLNLISGFRLNFLNPFYPGFLDFIVVGPGLKNFKFRFMTKANLSFKFEYQRLGIRNFGISFGKFENYFSGLGFEFEFLKFFYPGMGLVWEEGKPVFPSFFISYFTNRIEKTDFLFSFSLNFLPDNDLRYSFSFNILTGDEKWREKEKEKRRKEKEKLERILTEAKEKFSKSKKMLEEVKRLSEEIERKKRELDSLKNLIEEEKEEVEKMRKEALEVLKKIEGLKIKEEKEFIKITASEKAVHFEIGASGLTVESILTLKKIANFLKTYRGYKVKVYGHTDNIPIGPLLKKKYKDNFELSEARAKAVVDYFVKVENLKDIEFEYRGFGDTKPIASNDTEEGRAKNRRVEIIIEKK